VFLGVSIKKRTWSAVKLAILKNAVKLIFLKNIFDIKKSVSLPKVFYNIVLIKKSKNL